MKLINFVTYNIYNKIHSYCFYLDNQKHRKDKPAIISAGAVTFYENNKLHKADGPAYVCIAERKEGNSSKLYKCKLWYVRGCAGLDEVDEFSLDRIAELNLSKRDAEYLLGHTEKFKYNSYVMSYITILRREREK